MANDEERRDREELGQDPFVERMRPDPSEPPEQVRILEGLLGDSDREGYKRLYFTRELDHYAEFRAEDVVFTEPIPSDEPPFLGQEATRVGIRRDATVEFTRVRTPRPVDEFDLDVRLGIPGGGEEWEFPPFPTRQRTECIPCDLTIPRTECLPCALCTGFFTGCRETLLEQTRCVPCVTEQLTRCVQCFPTRQRTECVPCIAPTRFTCPPDQCQVITKPTDCGLPCDPIQTLRPTECVAVCDIQAGTAACLP
jgi:hypothetical protein